MTDLMNFEEAAEILGLDPRDEKRNRMLFGAVCEKICLTLDRNLVFGTTTETIKTWDKMLELREYPVRAILEMKDSTTNESLQLSPGTSLRDISRPDAHKWQCLEIASSEDRTVQVSYNYGYNLEEMPLLIKAKVIEMLKVFIAFSVTDSIENIVKCPILKLDELSFFKRVSRI